MVKYGWELRLYFLLHFQVYNRSSEICLQMYEKELLTDTSFLNIYGFVLNFFSISLFSFWLGYAPKSNRSKLISFAQGAGC